MYTKIITFIIVLFIPVITHAATLVVTPPDHVVQLREQFYVDVSLDTQSSSINGIDAAVSFTPNTLALVRVEDGSSIVPLWIERPATHDNVVTFAGIIPNGFSGLIDPFNAGVRKPGKVVRLVFAAIAPGNAAVGVHGTLTHNDGAGTIENVPDGGVSFAISNTPSETTYNVTDTIPPILIASRTRDADLYNNKYVLIFSATDKDSGINYVEVQQGTGAWQKVVSPYLLEDQSDNATLQVRAVDYAGNHTTVTIGVGVHLNTFASYLFLAFALLIGFPLMVLLYKRYVYKKK